MTREEAVGHILFLNKIVSDEYDACDEERQAGRAETIDALLALGVTYAELEMRPPLTLVKS